MLHLPPSVILPLHLSDLSAYFVGLAIHLDLLLETDLSNEIRNPKKRQTVIITDKKMHTKFELNWLLPFKFFFVVFAILFDYSFRCFIR